MSTHQRDRDEHDPVRHPLGRRHTDRRLGRGHGPALVMVHGSIADHTTFDPFVAVLHDDFTTYAMDRRGFGASGDTAGYTIERDFDDVAAVVDAVAARTGGPVAVWGHSYGANCAMGGATLTGNIHHLVLYEPSLGLPYPPGSIERIEAALARGDHDAAIVAVLVDILEMTDEEIDAFRAGPLWPVRLAAAPTIPRECHAEEDWEYQPGQFDAVTAPTLFLTGVRQRPRRQPGDRTSGRRHPPRTDPRARRARPLRPQDRPRDGQRHHHPVHRRIGLTAVANPCGPLPSCRRRLSPAW